jgi:RNA-directed DNA polymerase
MLAALTEGVKGNKWFSLIDKVYAQANLTEAFEAVRANKGAAGADHQSIGMFAKRLQENLDQLASQLREGRYKPQPVRRVWIPKPGSKEKRPLGIPAVRDRVVQSALRNVIEPIFEISSAEHSYGFRPGRGCKDALRRVQQLINQGYCWVVDADLKSYFDTIDHELLMAMVEGKISDGRLLELIRAFLKQGVLGECRDWEPEQGTPQGGVISPLLSNIYLNPLDHLMANSGFEMVRYADDFVILCRTRAQAEAALQAVDQWTQAHKLTLHPDKTRLVDLNQQDNGFDFLGYHFRRNKRWPRKKSVQKIRQSLKVRTKRTSGKSLERIISDINPVLRGWYEYFKHGLYTALRDLDKWVRARLRSILRKRKGGQGRSRGSDHQRWPNEYFAKLGLFSMLKAQALFRQSAKREHL